MFGWFKSEEKLPIDPKEFHIPEFYRGTDGPLIKVLETCQDYETRLYDKTQWVSSKSPPGEFMGAFWRLHGYIGGKNDQGKKMGMNMPVRMHITLSDDDVDGSNVKDFVVSFFLSSSLLPDLPKPTDELVYLKQEERLVTYVDNFSGFATEKDWKEGRNRLRKALDRDKKGYVVREYFSAGYDPPYKLWNRRNEMICIADPQPTIDEDNDTTTSDEQLVIVTKPLELILILIHNCVMSRWVVTQHTMHPVALLSRVVFRRSERFYLAQHSFSTMFSWFKGEEKPKIDTSEFHQPDFYHGSQGPSFKVLSSDEKGEDYETRIYEPTKWVSTKMETSDYGDAMGKGFWKLFNYIGGKNEAKSKVAMTCPVRGTVTSLDENKSEVVTSFFVDKTKDCPAPTEENVFFQEEEEEIKVYVRHFGGYAKDYLYKEHLQTLKDSLVRDGRRYVSGMYYTAGYDPPFRPWGRRNEVYVKAADENTE